MSRRERQQVRTYSVTTEQIMRHPAFRRGFDDRRAGRPPAEQIADRGWSTPKTVGLAEVDEHYRDLVNSAWMYERGRAFAAVAPLSMPLFIDRKLNPEAVKLCRVAFDWKWVI